ncbi:transglutaminase-like cysteine peptidase [Pseudovibrio sp. FO-BEG1]|uniref:transglutaminase-like cysteine peptidase n=1 Tax=Pseudovibrio sp. (strain FO-BEG1) TaxID=911045 RepID=UPI00031E8B40|nr:transglutaminase-like cysteine peptidase [Pseudovibrio sp. FO-BEG1]
MALPEYRGKHRRKRGLLRRSFIGMVVKAAFLSGIVSSISRGQAHTVKLDYPSKIRRRRLFSFIRFTNPANRKSQESFGLFGSVEISGGDSRAFKKWEAVLPECDQQLASLKECIAGNVRCAGSVDYWSRIVRGVGQTQSVRQLSLLNSYINESAGYDPQAVAAGYADVWRAPLQFLGYRGDCEDYAIAKYFSLLALGYAEADLRFIVVKDSRRQVIHAVTSVQFQGERYVLDSLLPVATKEVDLLHYQPLVSMQRDAHFTHFRTVEMRQRFWAQHRNG